ncbi:site-2 protease family protein [Hyperthermus butylicus]|uniref:Peptidase n=1 Tax=Hyperthermus butylicus (strain DSM 5456 / JCM 9403 / PLM1-5) TaxID=415426 RepID=A2BL79_HYPBU|nr:site-2 protease family protein [Hyperthermus butylicus]ABM80740.1 putative peptidase [Hyperthermus butylicus DSM 5456]
MASTVELLAAYLTVWLVVTFAASRIAAGRLGDRVSISSLAVVIKISRRFEVFEKLRRYRLVGYLLDAGIAATVLLAGFFYYILARRLILLLTRAEAAGTAPLVPIIPGLTISVETFLYLLPGLSLAVIAHELLHALAARYEGVEVKSAGFLVALGLIPAAFVEPDEEQLLRAHLRSKLRIYSAGILANTVLALLFIALLNTLAASGFALAIVDVEPGSPAAASGLPANTLVKAIYVNGTETTSLSEFVETLHTLYQGKGPENVSLSLTIVLWNGEIVNVTKPVGAERIGISLAEVPISLAELGFSPYIAYILNIVLNLALTANLGLALINAVPIFVTDGAQVLRSVTIRVLGEKLGMTVTVLVSAFTLALIAPNIYVP